MEHRYPDALRTLVRRAYGRMGRLLHAEAPVLAGLTLAWTRSLSGDAPPDRYFTHPDAFPMLLLPWWLEEEILGRPDERFQSDLVYSTLNGYYFVRLIDDLMDAERPPEGAVLPALTFFHTEFMRTYQRHFASDDAFWEALTASSLASAEAAAKDASRGVARCADFVETSARKTVGARIPVTAVCHRHGRIELAAKWCRFLDVFGRWHQMLNDILGWQDDLSHGRRTYFLSRAPAGDRGAVAAWVVSAGLPWGFAKLDAWMDESILAAADVGSPPLTAYLSARRDAVKVQRDGMTTLLQPLRRLSSALR